MGGRNPIGPFHDHLSGHIGVPTCSMLHLSCCISSALTVIRNVSSAVWFPQIAVAINTSVALNCVSVERSRHLYLLLYQKVMLAPTCT
jgi:hypothetical protein